MDTACIKAKFEDLIYPYPNIKIKQYSDGIAYMDPRYNWRASHTIENGSKVIYFVIPNEQEFYFKKDPVVFYLHELAHFITVPIQRRIETNFLFDKPDPLVDLCLELKACAYQTLLLEYFDFDLTKYPEIKKINELFPILAYSAYRHRFKPLSTNKARYVNGDIMAFHNPYANIIGNYVKEESKQLTVEEVIKDFHQAAKEFQYCVSAKS